jgi:hypothetical protein
LHSLLIPLLIVVECGGAGTEVKVPLCPPWTEHRDFLLHARSINVTTHGCRGEREEGEEAVLWASDFIRVII